MTRHSALGTRITLLPEQITVEHWLGVALRVARVARAWPYMGLAQWPSPWGYDSRQ